jgi:hypothetical protein
MAAPQIDPKTGEVVQGATSGVQIDPATGEVVAPARPQGNAIQRAFDNLTTVTPQQDANTPALLKPLAHFGAGAIQGATSPFVHPAQTVEGLGHAIMHPVDTAQSMWASAKEDPAKAVGNLVGGAVTGDAVAEGMAAIPKVGSAIRTAAIGDPDVAALKGLRVGPASPKSLSTLKSVEGARPYLQGVRSLEDAQSRVPLAKAEIWNPYQQAIDSIGGKQVMGPDGPTTIGDLENERLQISANLRTLKSGTPEGIQLAAQKGMNQADLLAREKAVQAALDPHLEQAGIDPKAIRGTFGNVAQVGGRLSGKSTLAEASQPYGFGKMAKIDLAHPLQTPQNIASGVRDLVAGRPWWSGKPTDVNLSEAFRTGGPKPDFRAPASAMPWETPPKQLEANVPGNAGYGDIDRGSMAGIPHPGPQVPPAPRVFAQLPETGSEPNWMRRYVEPPEPSTIRPMPPEVFKQLPERASPGETQPYIAHRTIERGPSGELTRVAPPEFLRPSEPMPMARTVSPSGEVRTVPRALLPEKTFPDNTPPPETLTHAFPAGSEFRGNPETPYYPAASAFRAKMPTKGFNFDEHVDTLLKGLKKKE